jgi:hypothetical protein
MTVGLFSGRNLNEKSSTTRRPTFSGKHRVKINRCEERTGFQGDSSIIEYEIVNSNNAEAKPGTSGSWVQNYSKNPQFRELKEGNLADFIRAGLSTMGAMAGEPFGGEFDDSDVASIFGEDQLFAGLELELEVIEVPIASKPGEKFPKHDWMVPEELEAAA